MENIRASACRKTHDFLFNPQSIVVVGASEDTLKPGGRVFMNIRENDFKGTLYAVNPKAGTVQGTPAFKSISELPAAPELAIIAIPAGLVLKALQDLADIGTKAVIILTAGFGEKDSQGKALEENMLEIGEKAGMDIVGPNCSGFLTHAYKGKFAGIIPRLPGRAVDIISGSGATVDYFMEMAEVRGLSFGVVLNLGNSIQYGVEDLVQMYDEQYEAGETRVLCLYMESVNKPGLLLRHAGSLVQKGCAVVAIKSGTTLEGKRAAASHTGAMADSDTAVQALFDKAGIIRVNSRLELIDTACALVACRGRLENRNICVVTDAGGPGVMTSDAISGQGLSLAVFGAKTVERLKQLMPPEASLLNPIDCLPGRNDQMIQAIIDIMCEEEKQNLGAVIVLIGNSGMSDNMPIYKVIARAMDTSPIPVLPVFTSLATAGEKINRFSEAGKVFFQDEVCMARSLALISGPEPKLSPVPELHGYDRQALSQILDDSTGVLPPETVDRVLKAAGFNPPPSKMVVQKDLLAKACSRVGFPLAMKVMGPLHKSDVGGVRTNVRDHKEALAVFDELMQIPGAEGVMLQAMISGVEIILGASREEGYGHLIMFGLGGIYTEVFKDVCFKLAPLSKPESLEMIQAIKGKAVLSGVRGTDPVEPDAVCDNLLRLSLLVTDFPSIREMDLNPLKGKGEDLYAIDARILKD